MKTEFSLKILLWISVEGFISIFKMHQSLENFKPAGLKSDIAIRPKKLGEAFEKAKVSNKVDAGILNACNAYSVLLSDL